MDTLFLISHLGNFSTGIQALTLVYHVQEQRNEINDRFYRALYDTLFDHRLHESSKVALYLNLLHRALTADNSIERIAAFARRLTQSCYDAQIPFLCGGLFLLGELLQNRKEIQVMLKGQIVPDEKVEIETEVDGVEAPAVKYEWKKREPQFTNAINTLMWELEPFCNHFHPTVALYARSIISLKPIPVPADLKNYDPILNHTLNRFLDRFVYKAPKKVKHLNHGSSVMQPRSIPNSGHLLTGGRKKANVIVDENEDNYDDAPVNTAKWAEAAQVPPDEVQYFNSRYSFTITFKLNQIRKMPKRSRLSRMKMDLILMMRKLGKRCSRVCLVMMMMMMIY